jgi:hypothetical protein
MLSNLHLERGIKHGQPLLRAVIEPTIRREESHPLAHETYCFPAHTTQNTSFRPCQTLHNPASPGFASESVQILICYCIKLLAQCQSGKTCAHKRIELAGIDYSARHRNCIRYFSLRVIRLVTALKLIKRNSHRNKKGTKKENTNFTVFLLKNISWPISLLEEHHAVKITGLIIFLVCSFELFCTCFCRLAVAMLQKH